MRVHCIFAQCLVAVITTAAPMLSQSVGRDASFEVVSIKPNRSTESSSSISRSGGRITFANVSLRELISFAYNIAIDRYYELIGPGWLNSEKFDVAATCAPNTSSDAVRQMSQSFLAERFGLAIHRENKSIKAYRLVVAKNGPKLRSSNIEDPSFTFGDGHVAARGLSMASLADRLSGNVFKLDRPVIDRTGIKGVYDFDLNWSSGDVTDSSQPSIFGALQEQVGLKVETGSVRVSVVIVDSVKRNPTVN
jgi:uncharacterized protein (TIGR03435 family)